jgi:hypothetical protein
MCWRRGLSLKTRYPQLARQRTHTRLAAVSPACSLRLLERAGGLFPRQPLAIAARPDLPATTVAPLGARNLLRRLYA